jgi:hypothetical protein
MTSGVAWNEDYADPNSDVARFNSHTAEPGMDVTVSYMRQLQAERHQEDQPTDDCLKNAEPAGDALRQAASDPLRPQMQVRQCRRIHHGKGGVFQPAFENVGLRIHAGSMGEGAIRRIGI